MKEASSTMEVHQDGDIMMMEEMKIHIKRKRTKRPRPSSALTLTLASTSSSSTTTTTIDGAPPNPRGLFHMPTTNTIDFTTIVQDNHDEDVANCLILLAQGQYPPAPRPLNTVEPSRLYVYECKTCNRGFTSFQALGGHRASHNKPHKDVRELSRNGTSLNLICPNKPLSCNPSGSTKGPKAHECSICGSDFTSGQALGGHMRRHRSIMPVTTTTCNTSDERHKSKKHKTLLPLDLNLPAPIEDDDHKETEFPYGSNNQIIVFSTSSLVDCHF